MKNLRITFIFFLISVFTVFAQKQLTLKESILEVRKELAPEKLDALVWIPGSDSFSVLLKTYCENVGRNINQTAKITGLTVPTY